MTTVEIELNDENYRKLCAAARERGQGIDEAATGLVVEQVRLKAWEELEGERQRAKRH